MEWIIQNKEWIFSGIGVALVLMIINFLRNKLKKKANQPKQNITQISSGGGDNVGRDKITISQKDG